MTSSAGKTRLTRNQITGFWASWTGWMLDGMDSVIYALILSPALIEILPHSNISTSPATVTSIGSILFAVFLVGWGMSFIWGPLADRFGRTRMLTFTILFYAVFTGASALSQNVWELATFRFLAGVGIGGEWAMAGTYVSEAWPEDRRKMGAGYLQTGYYAGFFVAAILNYTIGSAFGWRAMFLCGLVPVLAAAVTRLYVKEPEHWKQNAAHRSDQKQKTNSLAQIFQRPHRRRTIVMSALVAVAIIGLWAGSVYEPTAILQLADRHGLDATAATHMSSIGTGILSLGTIVGCIALTWLAERIGRKSTLAIYFVGMLVTIVAAFGVAFYLPAGPALPVFIVILFFLGFAGGNFAAFSLWIPELYPTKLRATAFAFCTSVGRFIGAGINFVIAGAVKSMGTLGTPVALTAIAFGIGLLVIPLAHETKGKSLPE